MRLGSNKKILGTILIMFLKFHTSYFLPSISPTVGLIEGKKEDVWNLNVKFRKGSGAAVFSSIKDISGSIGAIKKS